MNIIKRNLRYIRYRIIIWIQTCFTLSNIALGIIILTLGSFVFILQKLEDQYTENLLFNTKRHEIMVTSAKVSLIKKSTKCEQIENEINKFEKAFHDNSNIKNDMETNKRTFRFVPAIRNFRTSKSLHQLSNSNSTTKSTDIFHLSTQRNKNLNETQHNILNTLKRQDELINDGDGKLIKDKWLSFNSGNNKILVFSAYWDNRTKDQFIRVIMIMVTKSSPTIYCRLHMPKTNACFDVRAYKKILNEHWRLKYSSYIVSCPLHKDLLLPTYVTLSADKNFAESISVMVHDNNNDTVSPRGHIAVCVKPFHYEYDRATWLLEFLELHRMLGVDHFFFYNHTTGPSVEKVLRTYMNLNLISVFPWDIGIKSQKEIRTEAIFSSLSDCLYRTMHLFKYVIMLDFDEYIIPRDHDNYSDMIEKLENDNRKMRGKHGSFVFRNAFFYLYWENDTTVFGVPPEKPPNFIPYFVTQYKTRRLTSTMKPGSRSKFIVMPERALEVGNHLVWRHLPGHRSVHVPDKVALLHHYRICEFGGFSCLKKKSTTDQVAQRFGPELLDRVRYQCELAFKSNGGICPISPPLGSPW